MPTIFPAPAEFRPASLSLRGRDTVAEVRSVYSGRESRLDFGGQWWECEATTPPLTWEQAAAVEAWADRLRAADAVATFRLDLYMPRRGSTLAATVTASAPASAGAATVAVSGLGAGASLLAGSLLSDPDGRLLRVRADATASGAGAATLSVFPRLRAAYPAGATFRLAGGAGVVGSWRLLERPGHGFDAGAYGAHLAPKTFAFAEAFL